MGFARNVTLTYDPANAILFSFGNVSLIWCPQFPLDIKIKKNYSIHNFSKHSQHVWINFQYNFKSFREILKQKFSIVSDLDCIPNVISSIVSKLQTIQTIFLDYQSEHKIQKLDKSHPLYVSLKTESVGKKIKTKMTAFGLAVKEINCKACRLNIHEKLFWN